jgi:hypothetical protein
MVCCLCAELTVTLPHVDSKIMKTMMMATCHQQAPDRQCVYANMRTARRALHTVHPPKEFLVLRPNWVREGELPRNKSSKPTCDAARHGKLSVYWICRQEGAKSAAPVTWMAIKMPMH